MRGEKQMRGSSKSVLLKTLAITLAILAVVAGALGIWMLLAQEEQIEDAQYVSAGIYEKEDCASWVDHTV